MFWVANGAENSVQEAIYHDTGAAAFTLSGVRCIECVRHSNFDEVNGCTCSRVSVFQEPKGVNLCDVEE